VLVRYLIDDADNFKALSFIDKEQRKNNTKAFKFNLFYSTFLD